MVLFGPNKKFFLTLQSPQYYITTFFVRYTRPKMLFLVFCSLEKTKNDFFEFLFVGKTKILIFTNDFD